MSTTYEIACHDHRVRLWMGQTSCGGPLCIYTTDEDLEAQRQFFEQHRHCRLEFGSDFEDEAGNYYTSLDRRPALAKTHALALGQLVDAIKAIKPEERVDVFHQFCTHCGDDNPNCQCWNDE